MIYQSGSKRKEVHKNGSVGGSPRESKGEGAPGGREISRSRSQIDRSRNPKVDVFEKQKPDWWKPNQRKYRNGSESEGKTFPES